MNKAKFYEGLGLYYMIRDLAEDLKDYENKLSTFLEEFVKDENTCVDDWVGDYVWENGVTEEDYDRLLEKLEIEA